MTYSADYYRALVSGRAHGIRPALERGGLLLASVPYGLATRLRNRLYDAGWLRSQRAPVPVVSVGNVTLGGTGKTPCVEYVAGFYRQLGRRVAILSRGYGAAGGRNDEALVLEENLPDVPHLQGADRVALAAIAVEELETEVLVLDDGFQHRRLARDLDLVLLDATEPWGHGRLFPRGLLRESVRSVYRAGSVILTRCDQVERERQDDLRRAVGRLAPGVPIAETRHGPIGLVNAERKTAPLEILKGRPVAAFCGVGNPNAFRRTLGDIGAEVLAFRSFPDHHGYGRLDVEELHRWARQQATDCVMVTTQKDLVKLRLVQLGGLPLWALRIRLVFEAGQDALDRNLRRVLSAD